MGRSPRQMYRLALIATVFVLAVPTAAGAAPLYVSLGTSLAQGVQPNASGQSVITNQGYPDQLYAALKARNPSLQLVKLGCPGETTVTMIVGGICPYPLGSQLLQAMAVLGANRGNVALVTIDMGANDVLRCAPLIDAACVSSALASVQRNLTIILAALRSAGGFGTPLIGMNYYNPFLALWLTGPAGQAIALASNQAVVRFNDTLERTYLTLGVRVADVETAFSTTNFTPVGGIPLNVLRICQWTWMCAPPPVGPNVHANAAGYGVIAQAFLARLG